MVNDAEQKSVIPTSHLTFSPAGRIHTASAPAFLINEEQAAVVRTIIEMYASGNFTTSAIGRFLEERGVPTYRGAACGSVAA